MYRATITYDPDILEAVADAARTAPKRMQKAASGIATIIRADVLRELQREPGKPHYPIRWKSDKQRRFVMAKLRRENNLPYQRTGRYIKQWRVLYQPDNDGGSLIVENNSLVARFIGGDDAQPFHLDTGWPQAANVVSDYRVRANDLLIDAWYRVTEGKK